MKTNTKQGYKSVLNVIGSKSITKSSKEETDREFNYYANHIRKQKICYCDGYVMPVAGETVYHVNGKPAGIISDIDISRNSCAVNGIWQTIDEWKSTKWTEEERKNYFDKRIEESKRQRQHEKEVVNSYSARMNLMHEFCM